ncbi:hypothetical protein L596_010132 [Steinernema carpocapsae]|uniref:Nuclear receptor domain-containing protein n=1 Tax=Steinernema carpocapsae TaxID=34508 RepID=A0A4V6A6S2_STECR|nr:hypothetical protein L596_010132 [Steinernema carpocapsae]
MKKSYRCHKGDEKCDVNKSVRCMCRFCRFKKCIRMGMKITSVQHQRDAIGRRGGSSDRSIDDRVYETDRVEIPEKYKSLFSSDSGLSSASPTDHESMMPTLYRVRRCYHQFLEVRARAHPVFGLPRPGHFSTTIEAWVAEVPHLTAFVERAFDEYKELSDSQKWLLVRTFFVTFIVSEGSYRSVLLYDQNDHWLLPTNEYIDMDNPAHYFYDHTSKYSLTQVGDMMRPSMHLLIRNLLIPFREIGITDLEFAGLLSVLLWSRGYEGQNENCDRMASQIRDKITIELSYYYKEVLKIPCYVVRLSRLLMLVPQCRE